jgi:hypothetical protein
VDELEEKSAQNEQSLKSLKEFYAKVQTLNGDTLPKLPDTLDHLNANEMLHPGIHNNDLFDNNNNNNNDINLLERIKDNHKNLLLNIDNNNNKIAINNNNNRLTVDKRYLKQCDFYNEKKYDTSASSSTSSQIDVSSRAKEILGFVM